MSCRLTTSQESQLDPEKNLVGRTQGRSIQNSISSLEKEPGWFDQDSKDRC